MAYADWNLGGISARVWYRLQNNPKYTSSMRQAAIKKAVVRLLLFTEDVTSIWNTVSYVLNSGENAGKYAQEYELPPNTLAVESVSFDGQRPLRTLTEREYANTGSGTGADSEIRTGDPCAAYFYNTPERTKVVCLYPRPNRAARIQFYGTLEPDWIDDTTQDTIDASVPPFTEDAADALEAYAELYLLDGQPGTEGRAEILAQKWKSERAEFKFNQGINRIGKIRRERDIP